MNKTFLIFSTVMGVFFMLAGVFVAIYPPPMLSNPPYARYLVMVILILYGLFRLQRLRYLKRNRDRF